MKTPKNKKTAPIREFVVQILKDNCNMLFLTNKEAEMLHKALLAKSFGPPESKAYDKLTYKVEKQLGINV